MQALLGFGVRSYNPFTSSALERGECSAPRSRRIIPGEDPVSIVQNAGWASESV